MTDKEWFDIMLERVNRVASTAQVSMLKLSLSMRIYSPRVEMYAQMAHERGLENGKCRGAAADVGGSLVCSPGELGAKVKVFQNDYPS